jgi:hypothetical protein
MLQSLLPWKPSSNMNIVLEYFEIVPNFCGYIAFQAYA